MYTSVWPACVCVPRVCSALGIPKRAPDPHELELWIEDILLAQKKKNTSGASIEDGKVYMQIYSEIYIGYYSEE